MNTTNASPRTAQRKMRERLAALAIGVDLALAVAMAMDLVSLDFGWREPVQQISPDPNVSRSSNVSRNVAGSRDRTIPPYMPDPALMARSERILEELDRTDLPEWAGTYSYGDGYESYFLDIAPDSGFTFTRRGCVGLHGQDSGTVRVSGSRIHLESKLPEGTWKGSEIHLEFAFVPWGKRRYLIAPDQMIAFANEVRTDSRQRMWPGTNFFASIDEDAPRPVGLPEFPPEFADAFNAPPIRARILKILSVEEPRTPTDDAYYIRALRDLGRDRGAHADLCIVPEDPYDGFMLGTVGELEADSSVAEIYVGSPDMPPEVGWVFVPQR